jgi:hypothetical protein
MVVDEVPVNMRKSNNSYKNVPARISPDVKQLIDLLRIRKAILDLIPFL